MRRTRLTALTLFALFLGAGDALAKWPKVRIVQDSVRIGLPPGRSAGERDEGGGAANVSKMNAWAPVYFDLEILDVFDDATKADAILHVRAQDADGYSTNYALPLGNLVGRNPGELIKSIELRTFPYVRLGGYLGECEFVVKNARGDELSEVVKVQSLRPVDSNVYVVVSLGSKLASFDVRTSEGEEKSKKPARVVPASILEVAQMPDHWIGYEAADMVILGTAGTKDFIPTLFGEAGDKSPAIRAKREALLEWVRRGGRLVISVGSNAGLVSQYKSLNDLLPLPLDAANSKSDYPAVQLTWPNASNKDGLLKPKDGTVAVAGFRKMPERAVRTVMQAPYLNKPTATEMPIVVQSTLGLGRVTAVAFDLDRSPFAEFPARTAFWMYLLKEAGSAKSVEGHTTTAAKTNNNMGWQPGGFTGTAPEDDFASGLQRDIDRFEGVPVISFGWVALFVLLYTLLIGPIEYLILKKVFKKLELTWITFPIIVLTVSAVAYLSAYALKGSDLKLNKFDVVDVDVAGNRVYGRTWVGVFSPRIESYTVSVTPNEGWATGNSGAKPPETVVDWLAGNRGGRQTLFRSSYRYHLDPNPNDPKFADALVDVPIKVWSVKSFAANWSADTDPARPLVTSNLIHPPGDVASVSGQITLNLPFGALPDARLIYAGRVYPVGTIESNADFRVILDESKVESEWAKTAGNLGNLPFVLSGSEDFGGRFNQTKGPLNPGNLSYWGMLFHEAALKPDTPLNNASLRKLDQSWRLTPDNRNEVILVAKLPAVTEKAEELMTKPNSASPTQLWLKAVPEPGKTRPPVNGIMRQETYVRCICR